MTLTEVVLDANVLFRTLISGGDILEIFFDPKLQLLAPKKLLDEIENNQEEILKKSKLFKTEFHELLRIIKANVIFLERKDYARQIDHARQRLGNHRKDEDFLALALDRRTKIWTYEKRFFEMGFGISTKELATRLRSKAA